MRAILMRDINDAALPSWEFPGISNHKRTRQAVDVPGMDGIEREAICAEGLHSGDHAVAVGDLRRLFPGRYCIVSISSGEVVDVGLGKKFRLDLEALAHSAAATGRSSATASSAASLTKTGP